MKTDCIIDNWSLFLVSEFLDNFDFYSHQLTKANRLGEINDFEISKRFGALSNLLNAIIFYDKVSFVRNGKEFTWQLPYENSFDPFLSVIEPTTIHLEIDAIRNVNFGVDFYLVMARSTHCDLFVSPQRSDALMSAQVHEFNLNSITNNLLSELDNEIKKAITQNDDPTLKVGIESNQILPTLSQLVLAEANEISKVFNIAEELKHSQEVTNYKNKIRDVLVSSDRTKNYLKVKRDFKNIYVDLLNDLGINKIEKDRSISLGLNLWFLKISDLKIPFSSRFKRTNNDLALLKDLAKCRLEMFSSIESLKNLK